MDVNTLLKVLEQLLHKIKANRRREMVELWHAQDVRHCIQNNVFTIVQSLRCKFRGFQGMQGDRQCRAYFGIFWEIQLGWLDLNKAPTRAAWRRVMLIITIFLGECTMCHCDCRPWEGPGAKLWAKKTRVSNMPKNALCTLLEAQREKEGASSSMRQYLGLTLTRNYLISAVTIPKNHDFNVMWAFFSIPFCRVLLIFLAPFSRVCCGEHLGMLDTDNVNGHHQRLIMGICDSLQF